MSEDLVSVVIPAWNRAAFLGEAIASALGQEGGTVEVIVVDDGSSDETAEVAERFGEPVRVLRQAHAGIGAARNRGVAAARGEWLAFLDADDVWPPGKLRLQRAALDADSTLDMVFGHAVEFNGVNEDSPPTPALLPGTSLIRMASFRLVGPFREDLRVGEFIDWMARARELAVNFAVLDSVCLRRRLHETNTGRISTNRADYVKVVRAALQRKRGAGLD
ncbi:MAG: glycosyltransferase family A protein [Bryobacteraceae bacterium]